MVFAGEFIPMIKKTITSCQCAGAQALLGTMCIFVHISIFFFKMLFMDTIFESFYRRIHSHDQKNN